MDRPKREKHPPKHLQDFEVAAPKRVFINAEPQVEPPVIRQPEHLGIFDKDWGAYNNEFWSTNFYTPADDITEIYKHATQKLADILPANFQLYSDIPEAFGIANLELKEELIKPMKQIPLFSKLKNKEYEIQSSKSDKNISDSIRFFVNNLPSFTFFKETDELSWIILNHRRLVSEILYYYSEKEKPTTSTIKNRFNAITRIFRIAYDTKSYELYTKYSSLVLFLRTHFDNDEFNNELNEIEARKFVPFNIILDKQRQMQMSFEATPNKKTKQVYDFHQDMLLISLYSLIPPLRNEVKKLKFATDLQKEGDWIVFKDNVVYLDLNEEKKRHQAILFNLTEDAPVLANILTQSFSLYPRQFVFTGYKSYPKVDKQASIAYLSDRISKIFIYTGKLVSVNSLRSSYVSYVNMEAVRQGRQLTVNQKEKIALRMRTSRKYMDEAYLKIYPVLPMPQIVKIEPEPEPIEQPMPTYQKHLKKNREYYERNAERIKEKQREYRKTIPAFDKARAKLLQFLKNDPEYHKKMKPETKEKYNFVFVDGQWK